MSACMRVHTQKHTHMEHNIEEYKLQISTLIILKVKWLIKRAFQEAIKYFHDYFRECVSSARFSCSVVSAPWTAARQASLFITNSQNLPKLMSIELVMPSNHLILCCPLLLPPSVFPSIRVFSDESALCIKWPKYWSFNFSISPSSKYQDWFPLGWTGWISLQSKGHSKLFSNTTVQKYQFTSAQLSL